MKLFITILSLFMVLTSVFAYSQEIVSTSLTGEQTQRKYYSTNSSGYGSGSSSSSGGSNRVLKTTSNIAINPGSSGKIGVNDLNKYTSIIYNRVNLQFPIETLRDAVSAKLHLFTKGEAAYVLTGNGFDFRFAANFVNHTNPSYLSANDFNTEPYTSYFGDNRRVELLGTGLGSGVQKSYSANTGIYDNEYIIDVLSWYQTVVDNYGAVGAPAYIGFTFFMPQLRSFGTYGGYGAGLDGYFFIALKNQLIGGPYGGYYSTKPYLEMTFAADTTIPEPITFILFGSALSVFGVYKRFRK